MESAVEEAGVLFGHRLPVEGALHVQVAVVIQ